MRLAFSMLIGLALIAVSLAVGMAGYHVLEHLDWLDSFLDASMLLGGMGPVHTPVTAGGKLFAGLYALYCGLAVIAVAGVMLARWCIGCCTSCMWRRAGKRSSSSGWRNLSSRAGSY